MRPAFRALIESFASLRAADKKQYARDIKAEGRRKPAFDKFRKKARMKLAGGAVAGAGAGAGVGYGAYKLAQKIPSKHPFVKATAMGTAASVPLLGMATGVGVTGQHNTKKYREMRRGK
jgi:hypothetical protein